ncbi:hypothetical protein [Burkholderia ubonensis]|uniref:hypothetical protein n=2 Tax=Burkholderia ubonensis TaxID=101571 RepID=UPI000AAD558C|nr:hypothetical protein [Burkholderia ubonensis]
MEMILGVGALQGAGRYMRVSVGDILTYSLSPRRTYSDLDSLCRTVYRPIKFDRLNMSRLEATFTTATVYCWLFQNISVSLAQDLHEGLVGNDSYLGAMDVDFSNPRHLIFFRNNLIEAYRFKGAHCSVFYDMGVNEDPDAVVRESLENNGFVVDYEDQGARRTIFDKYDTPEHFQRIDSFKSVFSRFPGLDEDCASNLAHSLEELHPRLFDAFAAAARTMHRAETEEDLAQASLSGRRILEQIADYLFPSRDNDWKGRKVGKLQYKNRLWAYIDVALPSTINDRQKILEGMGRESDRLVDMFNAGLHAGPTREKVEIAFRDLVIWLSNLIEINPAEAVKPYLAYGGAISDFLKSD